MTKTNTKTNTETSIVWSDDFLIGIEELDYEHRRLVDDINKLHQQLLENDDADRVSGTLGSIHARMQAHFALEEHVMQAHEYPHYREHKEEHDRLLDDYTEHMSRFAADPASEDSRALEATLRQWTIEHILGSDKKMSQMITDDKQIHPNLLNRMKTMLDID